MSAIIPFQFEAHAVRVQVDELGQPWFNATDVCDALEMGNHVDAEDLQKLETLTAGGRQRQKLTEACEAWAEAMPYSRNGHSGYQILWNPAVAEQLKEVA